MSSVLQYIVNKNGFKTSVSVPVKAWEYSNEKYKKLNRKVEILTGIQSVMAEIKESKKEGRNLQSLSDFLSENNS